MKPFLLPVSLCLLMALANCTPKENTSIPHPPVRPQYALVIHGGAGAMKRELMTKEMEAAYLLSLDSALTVGEKVLANGGTALDAVEAVIRLMEDDSLFNSGRGAVLTAEGIAELDASVMDGATGLAGAVAGIRTVRHPISAARKVMEQTEHVMLTGRGAEVFAEGQGLEIVPNEYFITAARRQQLEMQQKGEPTDGASNQVKKFGTVGAVALDQQGNLAAGTSTGGMTNKRFGRVGDSPIIGAGTFADNRVAAVSCTGHGEYFIRQAVAFDLIARMRYGGLHLFAAADTIIYAELPKTGGTGGLIAMDPLGNIAMPFNTDGMFRAWVKPNGERFSAIYKE